MVSYIPGDENIELFFRQRVLHLHQLVEFRIILDICRQIKWIQGLRIEQSLIQPGQFEVLDMGKVVLRG